MATETVPQGAQAFAGWDSGIYLAWVRAMSDYGGLMHALTEAAEQLAESERQEMRQRMAA